MGFLAGGVRVANVLLHCGTLNVVRKRNGRLELRPWRRALLYNASILSANSKLRDTDVY